MHEWVDTEITAVLFALAVILAVSLGFAHQVKVRASRRGELLKLRHLAVETIAKAEAEADSMLAGSNLCSICKSPTSRRCSRCKAVRYCSLECQSQHWTEGHKKECKAPSTSSLEISENGNGTVHSLCLRSSQCMTSGDLFRYSNQGNATIDYDKLFPHFSEANGAHKKTSSPHVSKPLSASITSDGIILRPKKILFPYDYFVKLYNWDMLRLPCGLINCGNSCFANVVLQCLTYTRPLTAYLLEGAHAEECRRNDWCFMCELQGHVWRVRQNQTPFSPIRILSRMQNIGNHLGYGRQEDAHEFMRFAIDSMQSTCLDGFGGENVVDPASQQTTLIHHIFGGHLQSQVKCMQCQHESNRYESMMDLAVEIHGIVESLEDALAQFTAPELLDGENKYKCDRCNAYVKADKRLTLHEAPNVLTIALKRFQSGKFGKLNKRVTFPEVLYMGPYMSQKGDEPPVYKLYAVVVHVDMLNASFFGHYICYVKDSQGAWYQIDDSKVKEVEVDKVISQRAYMLFYSRSFARAAPITDPEPSSAASGEGILEFIRLAVPLEHQQSSILPPMQGAVAVPSSLAKEVSLALGHNDGGTGESSEHGTMQLQRPEFAITGLNFDDFLERKQKLEYIVPLTLAGGESTVEVGSCDQISSSLKVAAGMSDSTNASEDLYVNSSQILESVQVFKGKMEHNEMPLESTSLSRQRRVGKISEQGHEVLSLLPSPKLLDMEELPMWEAGNHHKTPAIPVLDVVGSSPSIAWPRNVIDMVSSIDYAVVNSDSQVQSPCCVPEYVAEYNENQTSEESDVWKGDQEYSSVEAMCPHLEGGEMLESMGSRREEGCKCMQDDMDSLALQNCYGASPDEGLELLSAKTSHAQTNSNCGEAGIFQSSSKALLELKTLGSLNAEMHEHKKRMEHTEPTMSLMRTPGANMGPLATTTSSSNCFTVLLDSPGKVLAIKELPGPDVVGRTDCAHVANKGDVENGLELSGLLSGSAVIGEIWPTTVLMPNITGSSSNSELFSDSSVENTAFRVNPVDGTLDDGQEICHNSPIGRINDVKQNLKPLLAPGFLNKSHRLKIVKSVCKDAGVYPDGHSNQGNGWATTSAQTESPPGQTSMLGMNGRSISASVGELEVSDLQGHSSSRASTQLRSYTNHNNGSKDGKKGLMDHISVNRSQSGTSQSHAVSGAFGAEHKQGRNESCACGSQQKWKKCCGKSSVIKGALADRQLVV